jgi:dephospho-CoA kinase
MNSVDRIVVVDCSPQLQRQRLAARNNLSANEIEQILSTQADRHARLAIANDVIYNDSSYNNLQQQVFALHQKYSKLTAVCGCQLANPC